MDLFHKKGELTEEEQKILERHTIVGAQILEDVNRNSNYNDFLEMSVKIAHYHHENWDGSGYPEHLEGEKIPLCAQIVHIANDFGGLTKKDEKSAEEALNVMEHSVGIIYNPEIFDILKKIVRQLH